jgi:hypothetical protein
MCDLSFRNEKLSEILGIGILKIRGYDRLQFVGVRYGLINKTLTKLKLNSTQQNSEKNGKVQKWEQKKQKLKLKKNMGTK